MPPAALAALHQSAVLNQRIATDADRLAEALSASAPSSYDIARVLRALSNDALFGARIVPDVARWGDAADVSTQLDTFYAAITATAKDGLAVSLQSTTSYVQAGRAMAKVLDELGAVDASSRDLAHRRHGPAAGHVADGALTAAGLDR